MMYADSVGHFEQKTLISGPDTNLPARTGCQCRPIANPTASDVKVKRDQPMLPSQQAVAFQPTMDNTRVGLHSTAPARYAETANPVANPAFYLDNHSLAQLKHDKSSSGLRTASQQIEALFLQQMLARMRVSSQVLSDENNPLSMKSAGMFQDMLDAQLAQTLSKQSSFGLAEMIFKQLSSQLPNRATTTENT
ncbi:rod-binding protein [Photobacterium sp. BZF1]|uniref:rod-binding protein n=1 Tax=Photobacterium sp. BZF1 TaxID=1904457 RepID=UPI001653A3A6|nr:rod-binding protein [Photobacterium sp. BZF1]MBC7001604.1 rod-binding protein [Photobacterium sp. BZF1]